MNWFGEVPQHWNVDRLKDVAFIATGGTPPKADPDNYSDKGLPWIKPDALRGGTVFDSAEKLSEQGTSLSRIIPSGSILVGCIGDLANFAVAGCDLCTNQQINAITFLEHKVDPNFGKYAVEITDGEHWRLSTLVVVSIIKKSKQGTITIPLPPLPEQKRIAAYLDASCAAIDRAVETKQKQLETLDALRKSIIQRAVTQGLNPKVKMKDSGVEWLGIIPEYWKVDRLKDCLTIIIGGEWGDDPDSDVEGEDLIVLRVADFRNGTVKHDDLTIRRIKTSKIRKRLLTESSLLVEKSGGGENQWVGKVVHPGALSFKAICSNFIAKLEVAPTQHAKFLNHLFSALYESRVNRPHVRQTTGIQNLSLYHYLGVNVALPPLSEQKHIATYLDDKILELAKAERSLNNQIDTLTAYRKSLVHECVTGKRRISDADVAKIEAHV